MKKFHILLEKMKVILIQEEFDNIRLLSFGKDYSDGLTTSARKSLTGAFCTSKKRKIKFLKDCKWIRRLGSKGSNIYVLLITLA